MIALYRIGVFNKQGLIVLQHFPIQTWNGNRNLSVISEKLFFFYRTFLPMFVVYMFAEEVWRCCFFSQRKRGVKISPKMKLLVNSLCASHTTQPTEVKEKVEKCLAYKGDMQWMLHSSIFHWMRQRHEIKHFKRAWLMVLVTIRFKSKRIRQRKDNPIELW